MSANVAGSDYVIVLTGGATKRSLVNKLFVNMAGPYANDSTANTGGVAVKQLYYDSSGLVHIRLT